MKARLFVTAVLLGMFAGCAHEHGHSHAESHVDEEALADELFDKLCYDLEHPPYYASSLRWGSVFRGMVAIGVLPEEADHQVRRAARSTVSARDVDKLLDKHEADAEAFLDALDDAHIAAGTPDKKKNADEDEFAYGLPSEDAVERWNVVARIVDRPPRCGNALHWLPVYKDLLRLGFSAAEAQGFCKRAVYAGMSRFTVEGLIDSSKRDPETFSENFDLAALKAENRRANLPPGRGLKSFFKGKVFTPKARPQTLDVGPEPAPAESSTLEKPQDAPAESGGEEAPPAYEEPAYEEPAYDEPADSPGGMGDEPPAGGMDEPPAEGMEDPPMGDEPPADVPEGE